MSHAVLFYPEFPNTFFLAYDVLVNQKSYGGFDWDIQPCDWNDTIKIVHGTAKELKDSKDVICYFGTENSYLPNECEKTVPSKEEYTFCQNLKRVFGFLGQENRDGSEKGSSSGREGVNGYSCERIQLPSYHPRFVFIPFDYDLFEKFYSVTKSTKTANKINGDRFNTDKIVTANDITDFPEWKVIVNELKTRGLKTPFFSDTISQATYLQEKLLERFPQGKSDYPIRIYYYGAPLTIFYLHLYPEFLPIKIDSQFNKNDDVEYKNKFNTYLYVYHKTDCDITTLVRIIRESFLKAYVDAIYEPSLLSPIFKKYKEIVPRGQFYTMRNVNDFAKAITLHCDPDINKIKTEILGDKANDDTIKDDQLRLLQDFRERTSESNRNADQQRVEDLNTIKKLALGCRVFLLVYYNKRKGMDYFANLRNASTSKDRLPRRVSFLYDSVVSCLIWEYVLSMIEKSVPDVSGAVLSITKICKICYRDKPLYLRYKEDERRVIKEYGSFKIKENGVEYREEDLKKLIAYTECVIKHYVDESIQNKPAAEQNKAYNAFSGLLSRSKSRNDLLLMALLRKIAAFKEFEY